MKKVKQFISKILSYFKIKKNDPSEIIENNELISTFEKNFNVDHKKILEIINSKQIYFELDSAKREQFLTEQLLLGVNNRNKVSKYMSKTPFFYEPEIIQVHNEVKKPYNLDVSEILSFDFAKNENILKKQEKQTRIPLHQTKIDEKFDLVVKEEFMSSTDVPLNCIREFSYDREEEKLKEIKNDLALLNFGLSKYNDDKD